MKNKSNYKILIVEDEESQRLIYQEYLSAETDLEVLVAEDGEKALEVIRANLDLDLILLDLMLPKIDGIKVLETIKSNPDTKNLKVYLMTVLDKEAVIKKTFNVGADGYLIKDTLTPDQIKDEIYAALAS